MKKLLFAALSTALLAGCAPTPKQINIPYQFDSNQAKKQLEPGSETLQGNAFLRQVGGGLLIVQDIMLTYTLLHLTQKQE
ncbi:lipoprotein [Haemophilus influenzae]